MEKLQTGQRIQIKKILFASCFISQTIIDLRFWARGSAFLGTYAEFVDFFFDTIIKETLGSYHELRLTIGQAPFGVLEPPPTKEGLLFKPLGFGTSYGGSRAQKEKSNIKVLVWGEYFLSLALGTGGVHSGFFLFWNRVPFLKMHVFFQKKSPSLR